MRIYGSAFVMVGLLCLAIAAIAADETGRVCVEKIASGPGASWKANGSGATERSIFTVRIDEMPAIKVSTNSSGVFTNLALSGKHLVAIRLDDKPLTSFRFSFEDRPPHLLLWYNEFYGTWSLSDVKPGGKCACPGLQGK
jgi:hypothetical protein